MISVRRLCADEWREYRELRLRALADAPEAFGSTFEAERAKPDEHWETRLAAAATSPFQLLLIAELGTEFVGLVMGWIDPEVPETAHVYQLWVAPEARGRGSATQLLDTVLAWARDTPARTAILSVTCGNGAARRLYERAGFTPVGDPEPLRPGSSIQVQPMTLKL